MVGRHVLLKERSIAESATWFVSQQKSSINLEFTPQIFENKDIRVVAHERRGWRNKLYPVFSETYRPGEYTVAPNTTQPRVVREAVDVVKHAEIGRRLSQIPIDNAAILSVVAAVSDFEHAVSVRRGGNFHVGEVEILTGAKGETGIDLSQEQRSTFSTIASERVRRLAA